jgi:hypothetical protein
VERGSADVKYGVKEGPLRPRRGSLVVTVLDGESEDPGSNPGEAETFAWIPRLSGVRRLSSARFG